MPHEYVPRMINLECPVYLMLVGQVPGQGVSKPDEKRRVESSPES